MIVCNLEQVREILPSFNFRVEVDRIRDFLVRAQQWTVEHIIGTDIEELLEIDILPGQADPHAKLRQLESRVICEMAYLTATAEMDLQLSEAGFVVQNNEHMSPASQQRVDRLMASLNERLNSDCDRLVDYLIGCTRNADSAYIDWRATVQFDYLTRAFLPTIGEAKRAGLNTNLLPWQNFYDLQVRMGNILRTDVAHLISIEAVETLLELYRDNDLLDVHRKAVQSIRFAIAAAVNQEHNAAKQAAIGARNFMLRHESAFPEFVNSDRYNLPKPFDFGEGTVANLL